jgi:hypothetical protein
MRALTLALFLAATVASAQPAGPIGLDPTTGLPALRTLEAPALPAAFGQTAAVAPGDWSPVGDVNPVAFDGTIYAVVEAPNETVYVGGDFTEVYGEPAGGVAVYDPGSGSWNPLRADLSGGTAGAPVVYALAMSDDQLVVGGDFASAGGAGAVPNLAGYDPVAGTFVDLGSPWPDAALVKALAAGPNGALFVGGGGTPVASGDPPSGGLVFRRPGTGVWVDLGADLDENHAVQAIVRDPANGRVWVGGDFDEVGGVGGAGAMYLASYTFAGGGVWEAVAGLSGTSVVTNGVRALAMDPDGRLYVGGVFNGSATIAQRLSRYDPATGGWTNIGANYGFEVNGLALTDDGTLYVGGVLTEIVLDGDDLHVRNFAAYDTAADAWSAPAAVLSDFSGANRKVRTVALASDGVFVGAPGRLQRWTGAAWDHYGPTRFDGEVSSVTATPDGTVYAAGIFTTTPDAPATSIAAFDGTSWGPLGAGLSEPLQSVQPDPVSVYDMAVGPDGRLYVGGNFGRAGGLDVLGFAVWDGAAWSDLGGGIGPFLSAPFVPLVAAVTFGPDGTLYLGVSARSEGGSGLGPTLVLAWDGVSWRRIGDIDRAGSVVAVLPASDGTLYAAGNFYDGGPLTPTGDPYGVLAYDGTDWTRIDGDLSGPSGVVVYDLAERPDGRVVATGVIEEAGGQPLAAPAAWDGAAWAQFGDDFYFWELGYELFTASDGTFYVGGSFVGLDGAVFFSGVARFDETSEKWVPVAGLDTDHFTAPNVFSLAETPAGGLLVVGSKLELDGVAIDGVIQSEPPPPSGPAYAVTGPAALGAVAHGDAVNVTWTTLDPALAGDPVRVAVLCPGQDPWVRYPSTPDDGKAGFAVPASLGTHGGPDDQASGCTVEVANAADPSRAAVSAPFVISDDGIGSVTTRKLDLSTPRNPARYGLGDVVKWFWDETTVPAGHTVRVALVCDGRDRWVRYADTENDGQAGAALPATFGAYAVCRAEVASVDDPAFFGRSEPFEVLDTALPSVDVLTPVAGDALTMGADVDVTWETESVGADATVRILLVDQTNGPPNRLVARTTNTGAYTWSVPTDLDPAAEYRLSVKVTAEDGTVPFALVDPLTFVEAPPVASAGASAEAEEALPEALEVGPARPNPARSAATVRVGVPEAGPVEVAVFDAVGRRVAVVASGERAAGWHAVSVEAGRLAPGVYVVRAVGGGAVATRTLTVVR